MFFNIDTIIYISFLLLNLYVGLRYGQDVKNIKDYALGGRNFSTGAIVSTVVATWASGSLFFIILTEIYSLGILPILYTIGGAINLLIIGNILAPKMQSFLGKTSVAEAMGDLYGSKIRIIVALAGMIGTVGIIAVQFKILGNIFSYLFSYDHNIAIIAAGIVTIIYSAFGGIKAVTFTDMLQFLAFGITIPLIGVIIWHKMHLDGGTLELALSHPKFNIRESFSFQNPTLWEVLPLMVYFIVPGFGPDIFQRISMGKDTNQVRKAFSIAALAIIIMEFAISWIPFLLFTINPNLETDQLLPFILENYVNSHIKVLILIAITAMAMSTADSHINVSSVLFSNDFCNQLGIWPNKRILLSRIFAIVIGVSAIVLALIGKKGMLSLILSTRSFYVPVVTVPLIITILGFRSSTKAISIGMAGGFITVITWKYLEIKSDCILIAMLVNLIFLLGSHYFLKQKGGWIEKHTSGHPFKLSKLLIQKINGLINNFKTFNFIQFCKKTAPKNELVYIGFGIYGIFYTITIMYSTRTEFYDPQLILIIYQIMLITSICLTMYPIWPPIIKKETFAPLIWNFVVFYMLVFFSFFFVMLCNFGQLQFVIFAINMIITALLVGWRLATLMIFLGFFLAMEFYKYYYHLEVINITPGSPEFIFMYTLIMIGTSYIIFLKPQQEYIEETEHKVEFLETEVIHLGHEITDLSGKVINLNEQVTHYSERVADQDKEIERLGATAQKILNNVNHELRLPIGNVINFSDMLHEALEKTDNKLVHMLSKEVYDNSNRVSSMILNMLDLATLDIKKIDLQKTTINFSELVADRVKTCRKIYLRDKKIDFELTIEPEIMVAVDPNYIRQTVDNLVINAINFSEEGLIRVSVLRKDRKVEFIISDQGKGIPKGEEYDIFTPFKMGSNTESKAQGRGIGLALCKSAVEAHGGSISAYSDGEEGATFTFKLPL